VKAAAGQETSESDRSGLAGRAPRLAKGLGELVAHGPDHRGEHGALGGLDEGLDWYAEHQPHRRPRPLDLVGLGRDMDDVLGRGGALALAEVG
jgi:hypothetical protein